ncbi:MAG TPA: hypothetical protein VGC76_06870 [Pyrinomonadaceae bacterium]|jgi:hypothetical protein
MPTIEELGQFMKRQFPGKWDDRSDREVGLRLKMEYPSRFLEYRDESLVKAESKAITPEVVSPLSTFFETASKRSRNSFSEELQAIADADINLYSSILSDDGLRRNVEALFKYYEPTRGRISSWWRRGQGEGRVKLLSVTNEEQRLLIEQAAMLERAAAEDKRRKVEFNIFIAQNAIALVELKAKADLIERAFESGMTVEDFSAMNKGQGESEIRATEYERKVLIDHKIKTAEQKQAIEFALSHGSLSEHQQITLLQKNIDSVQREISDIENNPNYDEVTKYSLIRDREETLRAFREDKRARQARLLQNNNGKNV